MKWKIDFNSVKTRISLTLLTAGAVVIFIMAFLGFKIFEQTLIDEIGNNRSDVLSQIGDRVRQVRNNLYLISNLYYYDTNLKDAMTDFMETEAPEEEKVLLDYLNTMNLQYRKSLYGGDIDYDVHLILENGWGYNSAAYDHREKSLNPKYKIWYKDVLRAKGEIVDVANYKDKELEKSYFCAVRAIFDQEKKPQAYLVVSVDERKLYDMYCRVISGGGTLYIVDKGGNIISSSNEKIMGFNFFDVDTLNQMFLNQEYTITKMRGEDILFTRYMDKPSEFMVLEEIKLETLLAPIHRVRLHIMFMALAVLAFVAACAYVVAGHMTRPLSKLCDFIQQIDEDRLMEKCEVRGYTEINILSEKINFFLVKIQMLLEGIRQKEQQKRKMELSFLQAQINPHFMYNTLFSVKCMVDMNRNKEAASMLVSFIQLLRSMLSNPNEFVMVKEEFEVLRQYVEIQRFRYDNSFEVIFECEDEVKEKKIPKLLIQPLLENAIFHGVELRKGEGIIVIMARIRQENLEITVEDNGVGIAPEIIERIERGENVSEKTQIGILNVKERIQLNFGANYGMKIESAQWKGTKITLTLPIIE